MAKYMTPQSVTVTGTLVDSAGNSWTGATIIAQFIPGFGTPITKYTWAGAQFTKRQEITVLGNSFSISLPSNDTILPIDSQWEFVISGNPWTPAVVLFKVLDYSKAPTVDISAQFTAIAPPLASGPSGGAGGGGANLPVEVTANQILFTLPSITSMYKLSLAVYLSAGSLQLVDLEATVNSGSMWGYTLNGVNSSGDSSSGSSPAGVVSLLTNPNGAMVNIDMLLFASFPPAEWSFNAEIFAKWTGGLVWGNQGIVAGYGWLNKQLLPDYVTNVTPYKLAITTSDPSWGTPYGAWASLQDLGATGMLIPQT